jgi:hypothetical protein
MDTLEKHIDSTLKVLSDIGADCEIYDEFSCKINYLGNEIIVKHRSICASFHKSSSSLPTVKDCYDKFLNIPESHPLKKKYNKKSIKTGYKALGPLQFNPSRKNFEELEFHMLGGLS